MVNFPKVTSSLQVVWKISQDQEAGWVALEYPIHNNNKKPDSLSCLHFSLKSVLSCLLFVDS